MSIEAWVTGPDGVSGPDGGPPVWLERPIGLPSFRRFAVSAPLNQVGAGSLEYHLDSALVAGHDDLFALGNLIWMEYRGKTRVWIVEQRRAVLDESEHQTDWVLVTGRRERQLLHKRTVWPTHYDDDHADPTQWGLGGWKTKTDASAALGQRVVPVVSTTVGLGATVGDPVEIVGGGNRQIGIIESIVAGVSVTLEDDLAYTFPKGSRVRSAASQWRRFVNRRAGEMLWDMIAESNARFVADGNPAIARGVVETTGADGWTQDFRFDKVLDVVEAVEQLYGDVEMDGLTFSYRNALGTDRTGSVIFEEGADLVRLDVEDDDRDSLSWVVVEGTGHAVFSFLAPKKKLTRSQRKTAARRAALHHRKAPPAPRKVIQVKADYAIDYASEAVNVPLRNEAFLDAKDVSDPAQLDALGDAALEEHQVTDAVTMEVAETRYQADVDYGLGDWVRATAPSRGFDEDVRIVGITIAETDDEQVRVAIDVNTARQEHLIKLAKGAKDTRSSLGVQNRQPQGQLVPFSFSGADVFDDTDTMDVFLFVPDRMYICIEAKALVRFREYFSSAKTASSGGGSTSGSSSASTTGSEDSHVHGFGLLGGTASGTTLRGFVGETNTGGSHLFNVASDAADGLWTTVSSGHDHGITHTHSTPNHTHGLTYGVFKETYPASHSVSLKVYELEAGSWLLRATIPTLVEDIEEVDLSAYIEGPGNWRIELKSDAAQPNGGRLGCDVSGYVLGAIQSA